ncbi:TetR/AcrR family transcriptional regulator [Fredinandcohnia sp. QZ13]|uniref:TetR/AcrR family transcriptional regulator n=1 Tax=Fredinandcohnia sp. QZ13 TaxID=3073144 RepID=UPI00285318E2|nr:TetR/AcrR family transcriptional regulator [Fredinandcohnia sp. QZ13]MDR4888554.1 TetR/AcrR family transcriptional regulator [Fredinandcohnia sp. QZ13]
MSINNNYLDRRIVKSKRAMKDALLALMNEKDFKEISISDIVREADLNRGTFYKHYQYKEDILHEIMDEVIDDLIQSYREPYKGVEIFEIKKLSTSAVKIFDHVYKYANFYSHIVKTSTLTGFQNKFCSVLKELALSDLHNPLNDPKIDREIHANYQAYAILGMVIEWINSGFKYSPHFMAEQLLEIIRYNRAESVVKPVIKK